MQQELRRSHDNDHVGSSRARRKFGQSSEVLREQIREVHKLAKRSSSELAKWIVASPGVCRKSAGASPRVHRMIDGSLPEEAIDTPEQVAVNVLRNIVVSTMIKLEIGDDPNSLILGQLGH